MKRLLGLVVLASLTACGEPEVEVEINSFVGDSFAKRDPELRREASLEVFEVAWKEMWGAPEPQSNGKGSVLPDTVHPPRTTAELEDLVLSLRRGPIDEVAGPAHRIAHADASLWPQIRELMLAERKAPKGDYRSLLAAIGGDVPNKYGHFSRAWKKAHGHKVKLSHDWFGDLLSLPRSKVSPGLLKVYRDCILEAALLQAASKIGRDPDRASDVVDALLHAAYLHRGTFRDEVGRSISGIGDEAVPHLLLQTQNASDRKRDQQKPEVQRANYAKYNLDRMDRLHPARAVESVREEPRLLAAVLESYGVVRFGEAADVLLQYADDPSPPVRDAARNSFLAYVTGPAPKTVGKRLRLLGGGTGQAAAYLTYRERAARAIDHTLALQAAELLEDPCELKRENGTVDTKCEGRPLRHTQAYFRWLESERERKQTELVAAAIVNPDPAAGVEDLNRLLATDPHPSGALKISQFFVDRAIAARDAGKPVVAGQLFRKAAMLRRDSDPDAADQLRQHALMAEADTPGLDSRGQAMLRSAAGQPLVEVADVAEPAVPHAEVSSDPLQFGGKVAAVSIVLFGLGLGFSPVRRRLRS